MAARVNRLGQTRATAVHHLVVKGTIEESIHRASTASVAANWRGGGAGAAVRRGKISLAEVERLFGIPPRTTAVAPFMVGGGGGAAAAGGSADA